MIIVLVLFILLSLSLSLRFYIHHTIIHISNRRNLMANFPNHIPSMYYVLKFLMTYEDAKFTLKHRCEMWVMCGNWIWISILIFSNAQNAHLIYSNRNTVMPFNHEQRTDTIIFHYHCSIGCMCECAAQNLQLALSIRPVAHNENWNHHWLWHLIGYISHFSVYLLLLFRYCIRLVYVLCSTLSHGMP